MFVGRISSNLFVIAGRTGGYNRSFSTSSISGFSSVILPYLTTTAAQIKYQASEDSFRLFSQRAIGNGNQPLSNIVTVEQCIDLLDTKEDNGGRVIFVDGSWHMPSSGRNAREEYENGPRIRGAKFFDIDDISSKGEDLNPKGLPHMMPPARLYAAAMDAYGISNCDRIVVYGSKGCFATPRTWFTFKAMGHDPSRVHVLNGGLVDWVEAGGPIDTCEASTLDSRTLNLDDVPLYTATEASNIVSISEVSRIIEDLSESTSTYTILDARSPGRFSGEEPEPRQDLESGHIPGSQNLFFRQFHDASDPLKFVPKEGMLEILLKNGLVKSNQDDPIISSCGSGVTACSLVLALEECGYDFKNLFVYDGSWTDWASTVNMPITKSSADQASTAH